MSNDTSYRTNFRSHWVGLTTQHATTKPPKESSLERSIVFFFKNSADGFVEAMRELLLEYWY